MGIYHGILCRITRKNKFYFGLNTTLEHNSPELERTTTADSIFGVTDKPVNWHVCNARAQWNLITSKYK